MRLAVALLALGGCSYVFVTAPPANAPPDVDCTESYALPVADGVVAAGVGVASIAAFASHTNDCNPDDSNQVFCISGNFGPLLGALLLVPTALFVLSAHHGASAVGECRDARAQPKRPKPWNPDEP